MSAIPSRNRRDRIFCEFVFPSGQKCFQQARVRCDHPAPTGAGTCDNACCTAHARYWQRGKDVCWIHADRLGIP
jgi:hypothetical protein